MKEFCQPENIKKGKHCRRGWRNPCGIELNSLFLRNLAEKGVGKGRERMGTGGQCRPLLGILVMTG